MFFEAFKITIIFICLIFLKSRTNKLSLSKKEFEVLLPKISINNNIISNIKDIFNSRQLFINNNNLTKEYIKYIRSINKIKEKKCKTKLDDKDNIFNIDDIPVRKDQLNFKEFGKLCFEEKLINENKNEIYNNPLISVILPSYNKETIIMKTVRSIQNQSFKNIEIIIVNDCSTDNSKKYFDYLLETDQESVYLIICKI